MTRWTAWSSRTFEFPAGVYRIRSLESTRGLAIAAVFFVHLQGMLRPYILPQSVSSKIAEFIFINGGLGTECFMVITGCFIYRSLIRKPVGYFGFLRRRLIRIYPVYLCVLVLYLIFSAFFPSESKIPSGASKAASYIFQNVILLAGLRDAKPIITVAWTISFIFLFYITMPLLISLTGMRRWRRSERVVFFGVLTSLFMWASLVTRAYPIRTTMFLVGVLVCEAVSWRQSKGGLPTWIRSGMVSIVPLGMVLRYVFEAHGDLVRFLPLFDRLSPVYHTVAGGACLFCFGFLAFGGMWSLGGLLSWTPLRWFGNMSYSYYLTHGLTLKFLSISLFVWLSGPLHSSAFYWTIQPVCFLLSLIPSTVMFVVVEKPSMNTLARRPAVNEAGRTPRRHDRETISIPALLFVGSEGHQVGHPSLIVDISPRGLGLKANVNVGEGQIVRVISSNGGKVVMASRVVWVGNRQADEECRLGLEFLTPHDTMPWLPAAGALGSG